MNRIDRLFAITTQLQAYRRVRASDLASHFEVSLRTIYRDIAALSESGVPIVARPGQGYALADGYFLPPLRLTSDEATALVLGARILASAAAPTLQHAARSAATKLLANIDSEPRHDLGELERAVDLHAAGGSLTQIDLDDSRVQVLRRAILERRLVTLRYFGRNRAEITQRQVEPMRLSYANGVWYLFAYCLLRQAERAFRLDRMDVVQIESAHFARRTPIAPTQPQTIEVVVRFRGAAARWAQEQPHWSFSHATRENDDLIATFRPGHGDEIAAWILAWGTAAEVLAPCELRARIRQEAAGLAQLLT